MNYHKIPYLAALLLASLLWAESADAQETECYRHTDCAGGQLCEENVCMAPVLALPACVTDDECSWSEICSEGFCKEEGVVCKNDYGSCRVAETSGGCSCDNGIASEWAEGSDAVDEDIDEEAPAPPVVPDTELYDRCLEMVALECEPPPDPAEECTPEALTTCTDVMTKMAALEETCEEYWDSLEPEPEEITPTEPVDVDVEPDVEETPVSVGDDDDGEDPETGTSGSSGDPEDGTNETWEEDAPPPDVDIEIDTEVAPDVPVAAQEMPSPYDIVSCCEDLQEEDYPEMEEMVACILALEDGDCDGALACEESIYGTTRPGKDEAAGDQDDWEDENGDEEETIGLPEDDDGEADHDLAADAGVGETPPPQADGDAQGPAETADPGAPDTTADPGAPDTTAEDGETTPAGEKGSEEDKKADGDGGCSFVPPTQKGGALSLLKLVLGDLL